MGSIRTFIAFETPESIRKEMSILQSELKKSNADVKWEPQEKFHATIKFLGNVDENTMPAVLSAIQTTAHAHSSFEITYQTLGCFPNVKHPRAIWIGCQNADGKLELLKTNLDVALLPHGFEVEERKYRPHVTLGRVKGSRGLNDLTPMLEKLTFEPRDAVISEILVMKSVLRPHGSEYSVLNALKLQT